MSDFTIILSILRRRQNPVTRLFNPYINTRPPCGYLLPRRGFTHQHPARSDNLSRKSGQRQRDSLAQCLKHGQREEKRRLLGASPPPARRLRPPRIALRSSHPDSPTLIRTRRPAVFSLWDRLNVAPLP